ncbi:GNAT family N-acetyltransferase [Actinoallomurus spadix]|uniref:N-acetyltransferase domain-containing protein n=1 Tax=Actinoallomurus spadix TaxID=79912 RepID=A0ABP3HMQ7_9ACTN|nr:GNAT family N-acetyltransferase [Actinoallomurus spadix]MCO5991080.1 GNAT family N-acetyltransferase [Actinoallomurus spadix]
MARLPGGVSARVRRLSYDPPEWESAGLLLRRYTARDHQAVFALHQECLFRVGVRPGDGVYYDDDFARIEEIYLRDRGEFLVGEVNGEVAALGGLRRVDDVTAEMVRLRVRPDLQGRGYGAVLVTVLQQRAAELGYRVLRADTTVRQRAALALYRRFAWREVDRKVTGGTVTVYLEKDLHGEMPRGRAGPVR